MAMGPWLASWPSLSFLASRAVQYNLENLVCVLDLVGARTMSTGGCRRRGRSAGSRAKLVVDDEQVDVRTEDERCRSSAHSRAEVVVHNEQVDVDGDLARGAALLPCSASPMKFGGGETSVDGCSTPVVCFSWWRTYIFMHATVSC